MMMGRRRHRLTPPCVRACVGRRGTTGANSALRPPFGSLYMYAGVQLRGSVWGQGFYTRVYAGESWTQAVKQ